MSKYGPLTEMSYDVAPDPSQMQTLGLNTTDNGAKPLEQKTMADFHGRGRPGVSVDAGDGNHTDWIMSKDGSFHTSEEYANGYKDPSDAPAAEQRKQPSQVINTIKDVAKVSAAVYARPANFMKLGL